MGESGAERKTRAITIVGGRSRENALELDCGMRVQAWQAGASGERESAGAPHLLRGGGHSHLPARFSRPTGRAL